MQKEHREVRNLVLSDIGFKGAVETSHSFFVWKNLQESTGLLFLKNIQRITGFRLAVPERCKIIELNFVK